MRLTPIWLTIVILNAVMLPATGNGADPQVPFWSPLTPFEVQTLQNVRLARSGDPDTLLAFALMASGDIRDQRRFDRIKGQVRRFVTTHRKEIDGEATVYKKGEKLLHAMHAMFFAGGRNDGQGDSELIEGYDSEQSQVSTIFKNGHFNCISSAILYMVLARYFDLHVEGVVTAHHAFIQLQGESGRTIEVETTSRQGYGLIHNEAFYRNSFVRFSISRNLAVPTYADYLQRRVLPAYRFIAENMNHQHTAKERMAPTDRQRLYEMIGCLDFDTPASQLIRLNALSNACIQLLGNRSQVDVERMFSVLKPVLRHVESRTWIHQLDRPHVEKIWNRASTIHLIQGHLQLNADRFEEARQHYSQARRWSRDDNLRKQSDIGLYKSNGYEAFQRQRWEISIQAYMNLLNLIPASDAKQLGPIHENIAAAYWNWANSTRDQGDWAGAAVHYAAAAKWTQNRTTKEKAREAKLRSEAMHHMKHGQWEQAILKYKAALTSDSAANQKVVRSNIGTAYINWGNALFNQQAYPNALDKYEAAFGVLQGSDRDLVVRNIAATYHNMTVPLLQARQLDKAVAIMQDGVDRFPYCTPCRSELEDLHAKLKSRGAH